MPSIFQNGGIIGVTLDFGANNSNDRYIVGSTAVRDNVTYVGGQTLAVLGTTTNANVTFSLTGGIATTPAANDLVVIAYAVGTNNSINPSLGFRTYTQVNQVQSVDTQSTKFGVWYKFMGATPDTTFERSATGNVSHAGALAVQVFRNVDANTPLDVTSNTITRTNTVFPDPGAITPTTVNTMIVVAGAGAHTATALNFAFTTDLTSQIRTSTNDDVDVSILMGMNQRTTANTFDPNAFTSTIVDSANYSAASITMALRPKLIDIPTYGNLKNSGIWNLKAHYEYMRSQYTSPGQVVFGKTGTMLWKVPPGVSNVSAVCVGAGGGGSGGDGGRGTTNGGAGGGGVAWGNFDVTPGEVLTISIGTPGVSQSGADGTAGGACSISRGATVLLSGGGGGGGIERNLGTASGGTSTGTARQGGGNGGNGGTGAAASGATGAGGAGGLFGNGGNGGAYNGNGSAAAVGSYGGGGGAGVTGTDGSISGGGGGFTPYGTDYPQLRTGTGGIFPGGGGFGNDAAGGSDASLSTGGAFGGGGGAINDSLGVGTEGQIGIVYIIWGPNRSFPSSNTIQV